MAQARAALAEEQIEQMIKDAEMFADENKKVRERVDAKKAFAVFHDWWIL